MAERNLRLRLGVFVAGGLAGLTGLVLLFGGAPTLFSSRTKYAITFPEAPGIATGTPVRRSGVRVGEVTGIELDEDSGLVKVNVMLDGSYLPRPNDEPTITRGLLSGDTALDFVPRLSADGQPLPKADPYPPGAVIPGVPPINPRTLINEFTGVIPVTQESLIRMSASFQRFEQTASKAERAFDEVSELARSARELIPEFRQTNIRLQELIGAEDPVELRDPGGQSNLRTAVREVTELLRAIRPAADEIADTLRDNGPELTRTVQSVRRTADSINDLLNEENRRSAAGLLKNLQLASDDLTKTIRLAAILLDGADKTIRELNARLAQSESLLGNLDRLTRPAADNAEQIVRDIAETAQRVNAASADLARVLNEVRGALQQISRGDGTLQKVIADPALYNNLNDAAVSAARLLARAERIAQDLQVFADKIARKPETVGLGGVVRPSTGLKEAPNAPLPQSTPLAPFAPAPPPPGPRVWPAATDTFAPVAVPPQPQPAQLAPIPPIRGEAGVPVFKPASRQGNDLPDEPPPR